MKTIRSNCFETNSSSTHSVTIVSSKNDAFAELVIDGVLHAGNLGKTSAYRSSASDGYTLYASSTDQKAALLLHHLKSVKDYAYDVDVDIEALTLLAQEMLKVKLGYTGFEEFRYSFPYSSEDGGTYMDDIINSEDPAEALDRHIKNVVLNPDTTIIDSDDSY
jgi:hypothetical protein